MQSPASAFQIVNSDEWLDCITKNLFLALDLAPDSSYHVNTLYLQPAFIHTSA